MGGEGGGAGLKKFMLWHKKNSYKVFDNEKKFLRLENSPYSKSLQWQ